MEINNIYLKSVNNKKSISIANINNKNEI